MAQASVRPANGLHRHRWQHLAYFMGVASFEGL